MIGLDTNVLVRSITLDDPQQAPAAVELLDSLSPEDPGFVSTTVVAELAWVLQTAYKFDKRAIIRAFEALLHSKELVIEQAEVAVQALHRFTLGNAGYTDYLIERAAYAAGCAYTVTFDQRAARSTGMRLLE